MTIPGSKWKRLRYYCAFTICFGVLWYIFKFGGMHDFGLAIESTLVDLLISAIAMLAIAEMLTPAFFQSRKYWLFAVCTFVIIAIAGSAIILLQLQLTGYNLTDYAIYVKKYKEHYYYWFWSDLILGSYFLVAFVALGGFAIRTALDRIIAGKQAASAEQEKVKFELEARNNQINRHFLFNVLNTIFYKIDRTNEPARVLVEQFSSLLRYQLYDCNEPFVAIENELKFISNYISLQQARFGNELTVMTDDFSGICDFLIAPFILMPLVENCFKHISRFTNQPNLIVIHCKKEEGHFLFRTSNTFAPIAHQQHKGIGIDHVRKRLAIIYHSNFSLETNIKDEYFVVQLTIKIYENQLPDHR